MVTKSKYTYQCPRCDLLVGLNVEPHQHPWCSNEEGHHSNKDYRMEFRSDLSTKSEPKYSVVVPRPKYQTTLQKKQHGAAAT